MKNAEEWRMTNEKELWMKKNDEWRMMNEEEWRAAVAIGVVVHGYGYGYGYGYVFSVIECEIRFCLFRFVPCVSLSLSLRLCVSSS